MKSPSGFWIRTGAVIIDILILILLYAIVALIASLFGVYLSFSILEKGFLSGIVILYLLYSIFLPVFWSGYTIGKRILGIRIAEMDGSSPSIGTMFMRQFNGNIIYGVTLGIAAIISAIMVGQRKDKRSVHDLHAKTYVTYDFFSP